MAVETVLILGSGPSVTAAAGWPKARFDAVVAINNAWRVREDWDYLIYPEDFPEDRRPAALREGQHVVTAAQFVPQQNRFGGFVYAGGTMAFTAAYWALGALQPRVLAFVGCDMVYPASGPTHFYGAGTADPLRQDVTLQSLEAKAARLEVLAAERGCVCVNLSGEESRLVFRRGDLDALRPAGLGYPRISAASVALARQRECLLGYRVPSGRYWEETERFDAGELAYLDDLWITSLPRLGATELGRASALRVAGQLEKVRIAAG
ncbi:MAG: hypothetical protein AAFY59_14125 [Pseudomonadota bacterium]